MPIFEYVCKKCDHRFEAIVKASTQVECPSCASQRLEKQLSVFATSVKDQSAARATVPVGPCGSCGDPRGPGACSMN
ncbi:MAG: FmdB family zinc ribbon protein [Blastocatellia bacterium]